MLKSQKRAVVADFEWVSTQAKQLRAPTDTGTKEVEAHLGGQTSPGCRAGLLARNMNGGE